MTSLDMYCHGVPFYKVWWESVQGLRRYGPTSSLVLFAAVDDAISCRVTSLDVNCHVVAFHSVLWQSVKEIRAYFQFAGCYLRLPKFCDNWSSGWGDICLILVWCYLRLPMTSSGSDDVIGCVLSCCSLPQSIVIIDPGVKQIWAYSQLAGCYLQLPMMSSWVKWCHLMCIVIFSPFHQVLW